MCIRDSARDIPEVPEEFLEPQFEIEAVPEDELRALRTLNVARRRLVVVDLGIGLGDRLHLGCVAGDVAGDVGNDSKGGDHLHLAIRLALFLGTGSQNADHGEGGEGNAKRFHGGPGQELSLIHI